MPDAPACGHFQSMFTQRALLIYRQRSCTEYSLPSTKSSFNRKIMCSQQPGCAYQIHTYSLRRGVPLSIHEADSWLVLLRPLTIQQHTRSRKILPLFVLLSLVKVGPGEMLTRWKSIATKYRPHRAHIAISMAIATASTQCNTAQHSIAFALQATDQHHWLRIPRKHQLTWRLVRAFRQEPQLQCHNGLTLMSDNDPSNGPSCAASQ